MKITVNPNRMQLLRIKKRLNIARKGHKLLKDKQDQLMRNFLELIDKIKGTRQNVENNFITILRTFILSSSTISKNELNSAFIFPSLDINLKVTTSHIMNLVVPHFELYVEGDSISYSYYSIPPSLDTAVDKMRDLMPKLIELAELEKKLSLLADEIDRTRRRVNALEYLLIPNLEETIKYISMKLDEAERSNITRLMRVKDIIEQKRSLSN